MSEYESFEPGSASPRMYKPGSVQTVAVLCLIDGIINVLWGIGLTITLLGGVVTIICIPVGVYALVVGILEIVYASQLLPDPIIAQRPARYLATMQIINILSGNILSVIVGILSLVFYSDHQVKEYFRASAARRSAKRGDRCPGL